MPRKKADPKAAKKPAGEKAKKDLDVKKDRGKDVKGGGIRAFSDRRLKKDVKPLGKDQKPGDDKKRAKDLDAKPDKTKDVKGGAFRSFSDARLKNALRPL